MDVKKDEGFEEAMKNEAVTPELTQNEPTMSAMKLSFPETDYAKNGKLKKVRGRVLAKLLKCEFKYYLPAILTVMAIVLFSGVFFAFALRAENNLHDNPYVRVDRKLLFALITSMLLFIFGCIGSMLFSQILTVMRYNKNFFKEEGYLTFSVPASMEEHVLAKRIAAVCVTLMVGAIVAISIVIVFAVNGDVRDLWNIFTNIFELDGAHAALFTVESFIFGAVSILFMPSLYGVVSCFLSKTTGKKKMGITIILVFLAVALVESLLSMFLTSSELFFPQTAVGLHLMIWGNIVLQAGLTVGCIFLEIWYLKNKLDLR